MKSIRPWLFVAACLLLPVTAFSADKAVPAVAAPEAKANNNQILAEKARADKKALVATSMSLTQSEAKAFWPLYEEYQQTQTELGKRGIQVIASYLRAQQQAPVSDQDTRKLIDNMIAVEQAEVDFRKAFAPKLLKVLPPIKAARYLQIEDKVRAVVRAQIVPRLPLVGEAPAAKQ